MSKKQTHTNRSRYSREDEPANKRRGMLVSIGLHLLLAILLTINPPFGFVTQDIAAEQGAYVLLGDDLLGEDSYQEPVEQPTEALVEEQVEEASADQPAEEELLTQDTEDAPAIEEKIEEKPSEDTPQETDNKEEPKEPVEETKPEEPKAKPNEFLFTKKNTSGKGGKTSNQGKEEGSADGTELDGFNLGKKGGNPEGVSAKVAGRNLLGIKPIEDETQEQGIVIVAVVVDRNGKVVTVRAGVAGSTTSDPVLLRKAEDAARKAVFDKAPDAAATQSGTITFNFKLK